MFQEDALIFSLLGLVFSRRNAQQNDIGVNAAQKPGKNKAVSLQCFNFPFTEESDNNEIDDLCL